MLWPEFQWSSPTRWWKPVARYLLFSLHLPPNYSPCFHSSFSPIHSQNHIFPCLSSMPLVSCFSGSPMEPFNGSLVFSTKSQILKTAFKVAVKDTFSHSSCSYAPLLDSATQNYSQLPKWDTCFFPCAVPMEENQPEHHYHKPLFYSRMLALEKEGSKWGRRVGYL